MRREKLIGVALVTLTLAVYWPAVYFGFVDFDDPIIITENHRINSGLNWQNVAWAFTHPVVANWHPVTTLSHMLDCQLFGVNPAAPHLVNIALHSANALLVFVVLRLMTGFPWRSLFVAVFFAVHPLRVESVAWISERKDVLSGFFFLLVLWAYCRWNAANRTAPCPKPTRFYWLALLFFGLGLMSKPMLVTVPCVLLLLDFWPLERLPVGNWKSWPPALRPLVLEKLPFFGLSAAVSVVTFVLQRNSGATGGLGWGDRIPNAILNYFRYIGKMFWPTRLAVIYPHPASRFYNPPHWPPQWQIWAAAFLLIIISAACIVWAKRKPYLTVGWFWYVIMLLPVSGLIQVGEQAMADRYTYLPTIGLTLLVIWGADELRRAARLPGVSVRIAGATLVALFSILSVRQLVYWHDTASLFAHAVAVTGPNPSAESGWGIGLEKQGHLEQALSHYRAAVAIDPADKRYHYNIAHALVKEGRVSEAAAEYEAVLALDPNEVPALVNLAELLPGLGRANQAVDCYEKALRIDPNSTEALNNFAWLLATSSDPAIREGPRAVQLAQRACELTHFKLTVMVGTLAAAYAEAGRFPEAIDAAQKACELATASGQSELLTKNQELLESYRQGKAHRE